MANEQLFETEETLSVSQLGDRLRLLFQRSFSSDIWVKGEVSSISRAASGHVYFDLIEPATEPGRPPAARLGVFLERGNKGRINAQIKRAGDGIRIEDGVELRIRATPQFYTPTGRVTLRMTGIDPVYTLGRLAHDRDLLLRRLDAADLLDRNARLQLSPVPLRVGLVTARGSAAAADFLQELRSVHYAWDVVHVAAMVQGQGAHLEVAAAIATCQRHQVDVVAVVRGGGARTDLVAFDHELVARTIATCTVPVLTGIGHEIDASVADRVAHSSFKTPTACAGFLNETISRTHRHIDDLWLGITRAAQRGLGEAALRTQDRAARVGHRVQARLETSRQQTIRAATDLRSLTDRRLHRAEARLASHGTRVGLTARHRLAMAEDRLDTAVTTIRREAPRRIAGHRQYLDRLDDQRRLLDPVHTLARGWSITRTADGRAVRSLDDVSAGDMLTTTVADGAIVSTVQDETRKDPQTRD